MFLPDSLVEKMKGKYRESSIKTMGGQIKRLHKMEGFNKYNLELLKDFEKVKDLLDGLDKTSTKKAICNTIMKVIQFEDKQYDMNQYKSLFSGYVHVHDDTYFMSKPKKELILMFEIEEIQKKYEEEVLSMDLTKLNGFDRSTYVKYITISLYTFLPPLRGEDYYNTDIVKTLEETNDKGNFYVLDEKKLYLNKYKTSRTYGQRIIDFPDKMHKIIGDYCSRYMIPTMKGTKMTQQGFTNMLFRIFNPRKISVDILRQSYITEMVPGMTSRECKELTITMAHSLGSQQLVYKKVEDDAPIGGEFIKE